MSSRMLTIYRTYFLEEYAAEGSYGPDAYVDSESYADLHAAEVADIIIREGLTFAATGNDWAANPDGSYIVNYATGQSVSVSAHLHGYSERVHNAIIAKVG